MESGNTHIIDRKYITVSEKLPDSFDPSEGAMEPAVKMVESIYQSALPGYLHFDRIDALDAVRKAISHRFLLDPTLAGSVVLIVSSLINHSCEPNLIMSRDERWFCWHAAEEINERTQLTIS